LIGFGQPLPEQIRSARKILSGAGTKAEKTEALAIVAAGTGAERDTTLLAAAGGEPDIELREQAALALSSAGAAVLPGLAALLDRESDSGVRYALKHAYGAIERRSGFLERDITLRLSSSGLGQPGSAGVVSLEAEAAAGDGFARVTIHLPPDLKLIAGDRQWHGLLRRGEQKRLDLQVLSTATGIYDVRATFWLKLQAGTTFKGGSRIKTETLRLASGDTSGIVLPSASGVEQ
jgi:hypothetical protein